MRGTRGPDLLMPIVIALAATSTSCVRGTAERVVTPDANFILVGDEYAVVIPTPEFMSRVFGDGWKERTIFYEPKAMRTAEGSASIDGPMKLLTKYPPVMVFSGTHWRHLPCVVFVLETRESSILVLDLVDHTIRAEELEKSRLGRPFLLPDGRLAFASSDQDDP